jgi:hypothetical protein
MSEERRVEPRYALARPVRVGDVQGMTRNLSLDGVLFVSTAHFAEGATLHMTIFMDPMGGPGMRLEGRGFVVRCDQEPDGRLLTAVQLEDLQVLSDAVAAPSLSALNRTLSGEAL